MKKLLTMLLVFGSSLFIYKASFAQQTKALYMNSKEFLTNTPAYTTEGAGAVKRISTDKLFLGSEVTVTADKKQSFSKNNVYGYRNKNNENFRFYNNEAYKIVDTEGFFMYSRVIKKQEGKLRTEKTEYFFSTTADGSLMPLTASALKNSFRDNKKFHDYLDLRFDNTSQLSAYDTHNNTYTVKHLYKITADAVR